MFPSGPKNNPRNPGRDEQRVEQLGVYEMVWDCKFCGSKNLPAKTYKFCSTCGAAQDARSRRFPSDEEKKAVEDYVSKGVNLICASCSSVNEGDAKFCQQCGASLEKATQVDTVNAQVRGVNQAFTADDVRNIDQEQFESEMRRVGVIKDEPTGMKKWMPLIIIGIIVLVIGGLIFAFTRTRSGVAMVSGHNWERVIVVEQLQAIQQSAWCDAMPSDAYRVTSQRQQRSSRRVPDGETCSVQRVDQGDGTFREEQVCQTVYREEPIYDDRCTFTVDRWTQARQADAVGSGLSIAPAWPMTNITRSCTNALGCEREADRYELYTVQFVSEGEAFECEVSADVWASIQEGTSWTLNFNAITGNPDCNSLEPAA